MSEKKTFSKIGEKIGSKLDEIAEKASNGELKDNAINLGKRVVSNTKKIGEDTIKYAERKYDEAVGDDKFCVACGKKLGITGKRRMLDGTLCPQCAQKYSSYAQIRGISLAQSNFLDIQSDFAEFEAEQKAKQKRKLKTAVIIYVALIVVIFVALGITNINSHKGKIKIPEIKDVYYGDKVENVEKSLSEYGFTNIWKEEDKDLNESQVDKIGTVSKIEIEGSKSLSTDDWVAPNAKVTIYYHALKEIEKVEETNNNSSSIKYNIDEYKEVVQIFLDSLESGYKFEVTRYLGVLYINVTLEDSRLVGNLAVNGDKEFKALWDEQMETLKNLSKTIKEDMNEKGLSNYDLTVDFLDDIDPSQVLAEFTNGECMFDGVNGINKR